MVSSGDRDIPNRSHQSQRKLPVCEVLDQSISSNHVHGRGITQAMHLVSDSAGCRLGSGNHSPDTRKLQVYQTGSGTSATFLQLPTDLVYWMTSSSFLSSLADLSETCCNNLDRFRFNSIFSFAIFNAAESKIAILVIWEACPDCWLSTRATSWISKSATSCASLTGESALKL